MKRISIYELFKRKKQPHDSRLPCQSQIRCGNRKCWYRGFYVDTVGRNKKQIQEYIRNQLKEDYRSDQLTLFEEFDPFTGQKIRRNINE